MKHYFILAMSVVLAIVAISAFAYALNSINISLGTIAEVKASAETLQRRDALSRTASLFIAETKSEREALAKYVIREQDIVSVIEDIEKLPGKGVTAAIASVEEVEVAEWKSHALVIMKISARGTYSGLGAYADKLELLPYAVRMADAAFQTTEDAWFAVFTLALVKDVAP